VLEVHLQCKKLIEDIVKTELTFLLRVKSEPYRVE